MTQHETEETKDDAKDQFTAAKAYQSLVKVGVEQATTEGSEKKPRAPFKEIFLSPDVQLRSHVEIAEAIRAALEAKKVYRPDLLYVGFAGEKVFKTKTFGEKPASYAVDEESMREQARANDETGYTLNSPIDYALQFGDKLPAIGVYNSDFMVETDGYGDEILDEESMNMTREFAGESDYGPDDTVGSADSYDGFEDAVSSDHWLVKPGHTLDEAAVAVVYFLPLNH